MSRFCSPTLVCVLAAFTASCETVSPDLGNGASSYRTAVGGDDADEEEEPQEPALEPEHTCEPGPSADDPESLDGRVLLDHRLPRTLLGLITRAVLGAAGAILQGLLRNALADPFVLRRTKAASATSLQLSRHSHRTHYN